VEVDMATSPQARVRGVRLGYWDSSVGKKQVMAVSGFIMLGYLVLHLWGNLKLFAGAQAINTYAAWLRTVGDPLFGYSQLLWIVRIVLAVALVLHLWAAWAVTRQDLAARPVRYARRRNRESTYASRTMRWGGVIIALFLVYHILDLTTGTVHAGTYQEGNVYQNMVSGFQVWYVSLIYIVAMIAIGLHLYHGVWSMFQTVGWNGQRLTHIWRWLAGIVAVVIALGNISIPVAVLTGIV
jgi:succinate dehydrogenase / fumarate reductase cytochrome b subunit